MIGGGMLWRGKYARWKSRTVLRPIPVAPPVRTTTLCFNVDKRSGFMLKWAIVFSVPAKYLHKKRKLKLSRLERLR